MRPGPGLVAIGLGMAVLAAEFVRAKRLLNRLESGANNIKDRVLE